MYIIFIRQVFLFDTSQLQYIYISNLFLYNINFLVFCWGLFLLLEISRFVYIGSHLLIDFFEIYWVDIVYYYLRAISPQLLKCFGGVLLNHCHNLCQLLLSYLLHPLIESIFLSLWNLLGLFFRCRLLKCYHPGLLLHFRSLALRLVSRRW